MFPALRRSTHRSLPFFFEPTSATGTNRSVFPRTSCRYVYSLVGHISRQRRSWGGKTMPKQAGIDDSGDPLWASLIQNRVRDNTVWIEYVSSPSEHFPSRGYRACDCASHPGKGPAMGVYFTIDGPIAVDKAMGCGQMSMGQL